MRPLRRHPETPRSSLSGCMPSTTSDSWTYRGIANIEVIYENVENTELLSVTCSVTCHKARKGVARMEASGKREGVSLCKIQSPGEDGCVTESNLRLTASKGRG